MCGRYTLMVEPADLEARFDSRFEAPETVALPRYNMAPGQQLPVITGDDPGTIRQLEWGLVPSWADDDSGGLINARAETIDEKPSFRDAYAQRRCLVLADGFYEWVETDGRKQPYRVAFEDDRPFAMAGLYERWEPPEPETTQTGLGAFGGGTGDTAEGETVEETGPVETFTIVTTEPNECVADLHHRMAVILAPDEEAIWLRGDPDEAAALLDPYPDDEMTVHPVSTRVNAPAVDAPDLIEPIGDG